MNNSTSLEMNGDVPIWEEKWLMDRNNLPRQHNIERNRLAKFYRENMLKRMGETVESVVTDLTLQEDGLMFDDRVSFKSRLANVPQTSIFKYHFMFGFKDFLK